MLQITVSAEESREFWDEDKQEFVYSPSKKAQSLRLEHSLVSISKWEAKWCKPFLSRKEKTTEEILDYIKCMTLTQNVDPDIYRRLENDQNNMDKIISYIEAPMTATTFSGSNVKKGGREILTSEVIYYLMFSNGIPLECEKWHINRLTTLLRVFDEKNAPSKKQSRKETASQYAALNAARRKKFNTKG